MINERSVFSKSFIILSIWGWFMSVQWSQGEGRDVRVAKRIGPQLKEDLTSAGFSLGSPVFLRIFKEERELEIWIQKDGLFEKWRAFEVVGMSGELGPKLKEGDRQAPEGFYEVGSAAMNPKSSDWVLRND